MGIIKLEDATMLIDLSRLSTKYTGTAEYAINITKLIVSKYPTVYILSEFKIAKFWELDKVSSNIISLSKLVNNGIVFDIIFTPYQYFSYWHLYLVKKYSKRNVFTLQDILIIKYGYKRSLHELC